MSKYFNYLAKTFLYQIIFLPIYICIDKQTLNKILLQEINKYRILHNAKKLSLSDQIIKDATVYAESLLKNSDPYYLEPSGAYYQGDEKYGENLFQCNRKSCRLENYTLAVDIWYNESSNYDFKLNKGSSKTINFTQMVWRNTKKMGCGIGQRDDGNYKIVCLFYPRGNVDEKYEENVLVGNNTQAEVKTDQVVENVNYDNYEDYITNNGNYFKKRSIIYLEFLCFLLLI